MKKNNPIKKFKIKKRQMTLIILSTIIVSLFFSGISIGKQMSNSIIKTDSQIAEPILIVESNPAINITSKNNKDYYYFKIKNYNQNDKINQIELKYNIEIISETDKSISFKLYKHNNEIILNNNKTEEMYLNTKEKQEDDYILKIEYDKNASYDTNDIIENIQIKVHSEQNKT